MNRFQVTEPNQVEINALISLFNQKNFPEMEVRAKKLTVRFPDHGLSWQAMGVALLQQGRHAAALKPLQLAAGLLPRDAQIHNNLANTLVKLGRFSEAEESYRRAIEISPTFAEAYFNLGNTLVKLGQQEEAEQSYREAISVRPGFIEALNSLAILLIAQNRFTEAMGLAFHAVKQKESWESKNIFVQCLREVRFTSITDELRAAVVQALSEPWGRTPDLARACTDIIKLNPAVADCITRVNQAWPQRLPALELFGPYGIQAIAEDAMLLALLDATPVSDIELERLLTMIRHAMLDATVSGAEKSESVFLEFYGALARQCFINEYVFALTEEESGIVHALRDSVTDDIEKGVQPTDISLITVAAYFPLYSLSSSALLFKSTRPDALSKVLKVQVGEPAEEADLRSSIPKLTPVEDEISLQVQNQYEENPYPRWVKVAPTGKSSSINEFIHQRFPLSSFRPMQKEGHTDILIAGCGTGQQPIQTTQQFPGAQVLAIDLSLTSLGYAKRKTLELGLNSISYAQADIMKMDGVNRKFDVIESTGVLHHLADPMSGWKVLLSRLRKGGLMRLGFYSEVARREIVRAQHLVKEQGWGSTPEEIRRYRQVLIDMDKAGEFETVLKSRDFFSISACRDLLFHVQEHRMTLNEINTFLRNNKLQFLGFELDPNVIQVYRSRFPKDKQATNLSNWQVFENENPNIFLDMYQFWVQKAD